MKTIFSILLVCFFIPALSQQTRLNVYSGYVFDDQVDSYYDANNYYDGKIKGGYQWGLGIEYLPSPYFGIEIAYIRQSTKAPITYRESAAGGIKNSNFDLNLNWIMLDGCRYMKKPGGKAEGFGGLMAGAVIADVHNPDNGKDGSATKFAWGAKLGVNIWVSPKIAIKLQGQMMSAVQAAGGGLYFGTGGAGAGVSTYSTMYQFGLGGGLCFALGKPGHK